MEKDKEAEEAEKAAKEALFTTKNVFNDNVADVNDNIEDSWEGMCAIYTYILHTCYRDVFILYTYVYHIYRGFMIYVCIKLFKDIWIKDIYFL